MAEIRGIFGDDDLGFDLDNIEEAAIPHMTLWVR
jgi:hypothetical protein